MLFNKKSVARALIACGFFSFNGISHAAEDVNVGCVLPLTGASAAIGEQTRAGVQVAIDEINEQGGIEALGGAKLNVIFGDSQSKADVGVSETERLIRREKVSVLCGAFNSNVTHAATEGAERTKTPWVVVGSVKDESTERGFDYIVRIK